MTGRRTIVPRPTHAHGVHHDVSGGGAVVRLWGCGVVRWCRSGRRRRQLEEPFVDVSRFDNAPDRMTPRRPSVVVIVASQATPATPAHETTTTHEKTNLPRETEHALRSFLRALPTHTIPVRICVQFIPHGQGSVLGWKRRGRRDYERILNNRQGFGCFREDLAPAVFPVWK